MAHAILDYCGNPSVGFNIYLTQHTIVLIDKFADLY